MSQHRKQNEKSNNSSAIDEDKTVKSIMDSEYSDSQKALALSDVTLTAKDGADD